MRYLDEITRSKLRELPSNDQIFADAMQRSRVVLGETALASVTSEFDSTLPVTGIRDGRRGSHAFPVRISRPAAQCPRSGNSGGRTRSDHDQARARRHYPAGADAAAGPGRYHAVAQL